MNKQSKIIFSVLVLLVIILASVSFVLYQNIQDAHQSYVIGTTSMEMSGMQLKPFNVPSDEPVPTIAFTITKDTMDGYDVHVTTTNFTFTPEQLNLAAAPGDGHVHLYIDDKLIVMLGPWFHIDTLSSGTHTIRVSLNNNDHSVYTVNGAPVQAEQTIIVP